MIWALTMPTITLGLWTCTTAKTSTISDIIINSFSTHFPDCLLSKFSGAMIKLHIPYYRCQSFKRFNNSTIPRSHITNLFCSRSGVFQTLSHRLGATGRTNNKAYEDRRPRAQDIAQGFRQPPENWFADCFYDAFSKIVDLKITIGTQWLIRS
ncbi:hypothetical protein AG1IA_09728 [Rhizoctonia solani AG-1 IA]|uniref:Secreted protein n=1 Tax=Thanatephorus cucumeris (strain AG1-IA) TaxID=983506 RepID=L8WHQ0_THACA|nr:hypothetical protein AG1IA_09728 [Rhizoctonia solani AG-1 IA]